MAVVKLDPNIGIEMVQNLEKLTNGELLDLACRAYEAVSKSGDNNAVEQVKANFIKFQSFYNDTLLPSLEAFKNTAQSYTDLSEYQARMQAEQLNSNVDVNAIKARDFSAAAKAGL